MKKKYIVRKHIIAESMAEAIAKEKDIEIYDCYVDEDYKSEELRPAIGFAIETEDEEGD